MKEYYKTNLTTIYNAHCLNVMDHLINNKVSVDAIITDPPYLNNYKTNYRKYDDKFNSEIKNDDKQKNSSMIISFIEKSYKLLKDDSVMACFCSFHHVDFFKSEIEKVGFNVKNIIIWDKGNWTAGDLEAQFGLRYEMIIISHKGRCKFKNKYRHNDIWGFNRVVGIEQIHQNQKPHELIKQLLEIFTIENDLILDPFSGSFTTSYACEQLKRNNIGIELEKKYCYEGIKRIKAVQEMLF